MFASRIVRTFRHFPDFWWVLFFGLPFWGILKTSFSESTLSIPPFKSLISWGYEGGERFFNLTLSLHNYRVLFEEDLYLTALLSSIAMALSCTILCGVWGYMMAYGLSRCSPRVRRIGFLGILLPFGTSFLVRVYAWMNLLSPKGILNQCLLGIGIIETPLKILDSALAMGIGIVYCYIPFMILPIYVNLLKIDPAYIEASFDLGIPPWKTFWKVTVPLSKPGIVSGCVLVFIPVLGEFVIPELLGGTDTFMIGRLLWDSFFHQRDWPLACAMAVMALVFIWIPLRILYRNSLVEKEKVQSYAGKNSTNVNNPLTPRIPLAYPQS